MRDPQTAPKPTILLMGTCDTKLAEMRFTKRQILSHESCSVLLMDLGSHPDSEKGDEDDSHTGGDDPNRIDIRHRDIFRRRNQNQNQIETGTGTGTATDHDMDAVIRDIARMSRTEYINEMIDRATDLVAELFRQGRIHGAMGVGGSCGTGLATAVMRTALPVGFPKLMVSTMASGDVKPYVEETDITMMYSVVDIAGMNWILDRILSNAAAAMNAMTVCYGGAESLSGEPGSRGVRKKRVGVTMFGVTTPCVDRLRQYLEHVHGYEVYVFHATGSGGRAMERLIREKQLDAVVDMTTTEIADEIVGGVLTAGPDRLMAAAQAGIPHIVSVGACDMVNFGPKDTVPPRFNGRLLHEHNPAVTLVRTSTVECQKIGRFIAQKLLDNACRPDLIHVILPTGGISLIDVPGQSFHDPQADTVLFSTLEERLRDSEIRVIRDERDINDPGFAVSAADSLAELIRKSES